MSLNGTNACGGDACDIFLIKKTQILKLLVVKNAKKCNFVLE